MMFINSIFLPKNLSDQTLPEGVVNTIGNFSHLFSNVFKFVKDGQESQNPIQLIPQTEISIEDVQSELLKVSMLSDNKIVQENSSIPKIVELFLSKIEAGRFVKDLADSNKVKVSEKTPKDILLSKEDFVKEIKNLLETLKNGEASQIENVEISIISGGVSISINPKVTSVAEIETLIKEQLQTNDDFKILVQSGNQKLSFEVEAIKSNLNNSIAPLEIIFNENKSETTKKYVNKVDGESNLLVKNESKNITLNSANNENSQIPVQPYKLGIKQAFSLNENNTEKETNVTLAKIEKPILEKQTTVLNNQTIVTKPSVEKTDNGIQIPELEKHTEKSNVVSKNISQDLSLNKTVSENVKPETIKTTEVNKTDKKISIKSNQKLNSFSVNKSSIEEKMDLNDLVEKTEVKEIKIDVQSFPQKQNLNLPQQKVDAKVEVVSEKTNVEKPVTEIKNSLNVKPSAEVKPDNQHAASKKTEVKSEPIHSFESFKKTNEAGIKQEVKSENIIAAKSKPEVKSVAQQELFNDNEIEIVDGEVVDTQKIEIKPEKPFVYKVQTSESSKTAKSELNTQEEINIEKPVEIVKSTTTKNVISIKQDLKPQEHLTAETKVESKPELKQENSDWFKSKIVVDSKPQAKEINLKTSETVEVKSKTNISFDAKTPVEFSENESFEKFINKGKQVVDLKSNSNLTKEDFNHSNETKTTENTLKPFQKIVELIKIKPVSFIKEDIKQVDKLESPTEEIKTENVKTDSKILEPIQKAAEQIKTKPVSFIKENIKLVEKPESQIEEVKTENVKTNSDVESAKSVDHKSSDGKVTRDVKENNSVKIDFKERRVYSQIPKLEVISDDKPVLENIKLPSEPLIKEKTQVTDEAIKSTPEQIEAKPKDEKQVWVKVSFEKTETENQQETKKSTIANKITVNVNDDVKKDFSSSDYSQDETNENQKQKPQTVIAESNQSSETKSSVQTQNNTTQQDIVSSIKPEHKTVQTLFKSELQSENVKYGSRTAEMVEKVKVISSGEMVREVYKVLENGEKQSVVLKLVPKELGAIKVMLDTIDNVLTAKVEVENESVGQVIRNNVEQLKHNLAQSGVNVNSINISYQSSEQKQQGFNNQKKKNPTYFRNSEQQEVDENVVTKKLGYNTYEYLA